jgi:hypothetical protein
MRLGEIQYQRALPWDEEYVNPRKIVKDPPCGGVLYRCALLVWEGGSVVLEGIANGFFDRITALIADARLSGETAKTPLCTMPTPGLVVQACNDPALQPGR